MEEADELAVRVAYLYPGKADLGADLAGCSFAGVPNGIRPGRVFRIGLLVELRDGGEPALDGRCLRASPREVCQLECDGPRVCWERAEVPGDAGSPPRDFAFGRPCDAYHGSRSGRARLNVSKASATVGARARETSAVLSG